MTVPLNYVISRLHCIHMCILTLHKTQYVFLVLDLRIDRKTCLSIRRSRQTVMSAHVKRVCVWNSYIHGMGINCIQLTWFATGQHYLKIHECQWHVRGGIIHTSQLQQTENEKLYISQFLLAWTVLTLCP